MKNFICMNLAFLLLFFYSCGIKKVEKVTLSINGRPLIVEVARTESQRRKGLMNRNELGWNEGMLFIFDDERYPSFWMKDTPIHLAIAFLDKNGKVTDIFDMEPYSLKPVRSTSLSRYAIEVNRKFFDECNLSVGDTVDLDVIRKK